MKLCLGRIRSDADVSPGVEPDIGSVRIQQT